MKRNFMGRRRESGFTLVEVLLGGITLAIVTSAILGAYIGQITLNEHARNLSLVIQDANRIIEQIRQQNTTCTSPNVIPPAGTSWNAWLEAQVPGKSITSATPNVAERILVTCSHRDGPASGLCGSNQAGAGEWTNPAGNTTHDPLRVTVAVCWRHRNRTIGECTWNGAALVPDDAVAMPNDTLGAIDSPAMLTTLVTCRG